MHTFDSVAIWRPRHLILGWLIAACPLTLTADQWRPYPADLPVFNFDGDSLQQQWDLLHRDTVQQYPSSEWVAAQLAHPGLCKATLKARAGHENVDGANAAPDEDCSAIDSGHIAVILQQAWRDYFVGNYQAAVHAGEALGLIGYPVAGYARIAYGQMLARSREEKIQVLEQAITRADAYEQVAPGSAYSLLISAYAMARIMEDLSMSAALVTGYNSEARQQLETLIQAYPKHARGAATYGGYNGGIIGKSGQFVARISYSATPEKMESGFATAMRVDPPVISTHLEYAIALTRVYRDKQREKARQTLEDTVVLTPLAAQEALALKHARALLAAFDQQ